MVETKGIVVGGFIVIIAGLLGRALAGDIPEGSPAKQAVQNVRTAAQPIPIESTQTVRTIVEEPSFVPEDQLTTAEKSALSGEAEQTGIVRPDTTIDDGTTTFVTDNPDTEVDDVTGVVTESDMETTADGTIVEDEAGRILFRTESGQLIGT